ncbi:MAG: FecR domain-containing protein [Deltaproteobacteria bacterium]|nr:FecR domain-containing protein [Deltaproteobacteria bacterium]MBN2672150.1 FecR domain-containing protein [Deltaproteobacteria bacterium]
MKVDQMECGRFKELYNQLNRQVPIPPPERALMEAHMQFCDACRADARLSKLMNDNAGFLVDELADRRRIEWAISYAQQQNSTTQRDAWTDAPQRIRYGIGLAGAVAVLLLGVGLVALWLWRPTTEVVFKAAWNDGYSANTSSTVSSNERKRLTPAITAAQASAHQSKNALLDNGIQIGNDSERTFVTMGQGIDVSLEAGSSVAIVHSTPSLLRIRLESGFLLASVNPDIPHPHFIVETKLGNVEVKGTIFSVSVAAQVRVEVLRGTVAVTYDDQENYVTMGSGFEFYTRTMYAVSPAQKQVLAQRLQLLTQTVSSHKIQMLTPYTIRDSLPALAERGRQGSISVGTDSVTKNDADDGQHKNSISTVSAATDKRAVDNSLDSLLQEAREKKAARNWAGALAAYETIVRLYPGSAEGSSSLVAAGNLRLKFGDAKGALAHFNTYLRNQTAPLKEEAMFGKIKSLRKLNNEAAELSAMRDFVSLFPGSLHAQSMQQRIVILELTKTE